MFINALNARDGGEASIEINVNSIIFINLAIRPANVKLGIEIETFMLLEKWYLDAVFPDGTVWFGYHAQLQLMRGLRIPWAAGSEFAAGCREHKITCWKSLAAPRLENGQWQWNGPDGFGGRWKPAGHAIESALGSDERFRVNWNCVAPRATVTRNQGDEVTSQGTGYVEHLRLESSRPALPFRNLWWGRAHAGNASLVWIRWKEGRELCLLFEDGVKVDGQLETLFDGGVRIHTAQGCWETGKGRPLCDRDVRRSFPRWLVWLTGKMAPARELKLAGPVQFRTHATEFTGTGIWEEVRWT